MILLILSYTFLILGTLSLLLASIGIYTMPDLLCKLHAATKATTTGVSCLAIAYVLKEQSFSAAILSAGIILFLFITVPVASHVVSARYLSLKE